MLFQPEIDAIILGRGKFPLKNEYYHVKFHPKIFPGLDYSRIPRDLVEYLFPENRGDSTDELSNADDDQVLINDNDQQPTDNINETTVINNDIEDQIGEFELPIDDGRLKEPSEPRRSRRLAGLYPTQGEAPTSPIASQATYNPRPKVKFDSDYKVFLRDFEKLACGNVSNKLRSRELKSKIEVRDIGDANWILKIQLQRVPGGMWIGQTVYAQKILEASNLWDIPESEWKQTPMIVNWNHDENSTKLTIALLSIGHSDDLTCFYYLSLILVYEGEYLIRRFDQ
ncbi:hypothetical protein HDU76_005007 [Blyttiomyces sp. JEL0837]|nr:hypothetical protein HDU76_005007 [Blyttiomyces sp. JEL0837]